MKAVYTNAALTDLEEIITYTRQNFPRSAEALERRIRSAIARIERWPLSGRRIDGWPDVRTVPLIRFPFRIFYTIAGGEIHILHIHHAARDD